MIASSVADLNTVQVVRENWPEEREHRQLQFRKGLGRQSIEGSCIGTLFLFQNSFCFNLMFDGQGLAIFCLPVFLASDSSNEIILQREFDEGAIVPGKS